MEVKSFTRKSHNWNEDRFINRDNMFVVIDGATPLKKQTDFNGARWLVGYIKKNFSKYSGCVNERLTNLCRDAYGEIPVKNKSSEYLPSASAAWLEIHGDKGEIGLLGDCEVTLKYADGRIERFYDDRLSKLDGAALEEMIAVSKKENIAINEARKLIQPTLIKHRNLANAPNGYSALTVSEHFTINEKRFTVDTKKVKTAFIYSDGFSQAFENLNIYHDHETMFSSIVDIDKEIKKIVKVSYSDKTLDKYPRFKIIDDITITKIDF